MLEGILLLELKEGSMHFVIYQLVSEHLLLEMVQLNMLEELMALL
jgi:hypothetical protein